MTTKMPGLRTKYHIDVSNPEQALAEVQPLLEQGRYLDAIDIFEHIYIACPDIQVPLLSQLYDLYMSLPDSESRYSLYQARHFDFNIQPGDKVLDIGSGNLPFPLATHLSDISTEDHAYGRAGQAFKHVNGKPVYECNLENMPFEDNEFDFVYSAHVLEHVENPEVACKELMRIAKRGYFETPTRGKDLFLDTAAISNHIWKVEYFDNRTIFTEYTQDELLGLQSSVLMSMHCAPETDREKAFAALVLLRSDMLNTMVMWEDGFDFEVRRIGKSPWNYCHREQPKTEPIPTSTTTSTPKARAKTQHPSCLFLDTCYQGFLDKHYQSHLDLHLSPYKTQLASILSAGFGDSDFYSGWLAKHGWDTENIIVNCAPLQQRWAQEHNCKERDDALVLRQIAAKQPDVLYCQDMHILSEAFLTEAKKHTKLLVGQIASSIGEIPIHCYDVIISSIAPLVDYFRSQGVASFYVPLAFEPRLLESLRVPPSYAERPIQCSFAGGIASAVHQGRLELLTTLSEELPIEFWGYGVETLPPDSPIISRYRGQAWGPELFQVLASSKITVNKHAEVMYPDLRAEAGALRNSTTNFANNMRLFEATAAGALLITEYKDNLPDLFEIGKEVVAYRSANECVELVRYYMQHPEEAAQIAAAGQKRTLTEHTYENRMNAVAEYLSRLLRIKEEAVNNALPNFERISSDYQAIADSEVTTEQENAWKSSDIPQRQRSLVQWELEKMYHGEMVEPYNVLAQALKPIAKPNSKVLEIGCSSGYYYEVLEYLMNRKLDYTGVDYSSAMIHMAKDYYPSAEFLEADGAQMPFRDGEFEVAISSCILLHTPNYQDHIKETARVASKFIIAHRTPICRTRTTQFYRKKAYEVETVELRFNEDEFLEEFRKQGFKELGRIQLEQHERADEYCVTYLFERSAVNSSFELNEFQPQA